MVIRTLGAFHPRAVPAVSRRNYRRELVSALFFPVALAAVEGVVIAVIVKGAFAPVVPELTLNIVVGLLTAMPELANITSFLWAAIGHGRDKVRLINLLQAVVILMVAIVAIAPRTEVGLGMLVLAMATARGAMAGVFTLRATVWSMNYSRAERARATGRFAMVQALVLAAIAMLVGAGRDLGDDAFRVLLLVACAVGSVGVWSYGRIRLRRHRLLLKQELSSAERPRWSPLALAQVLQRDGNYARFQVWMNVLGVGNLMLSAPLALLLKEHFRVSTLEGVAITYGAPTIVVPFVVPFWTRVLVDRHVVAFRAIHSWAFVASQSVVLLGAVLEQMPLLYVGMLMQGIGYAGGALAWNLGHLDFAPPHLASRYMGVHVTLNGVRGLLGPMVAVAGYEWLKRFDRGWEHWVFAISVLTCVAGAIGFVRLSRRMNVPTRFERAA